ncbi:MAG: RsmD family RNA methyltransferase, partial [Bdellovibrionales bacterium]|nr:RsmD family RNA methyltransferase [Bdellovibrionales bacterium]
DPPFTQSLAHNSMEAIANLVTPKTVTKVVIESSGQERIDEQYSHLNLLDRKIFGDKTLSIFSTES